MLRYSTLPVARKFTSASSSQLSVDTAIAQAEPLTMACWFNTDSATAGQCLMWLGDKDVSNREMYLALRGDVAGDPVSVDVNSAGAGLRALTSTSYSTNTWQHACGVFATTTSRAVYLNGGGKGTATFERSATTFDRTSIGYLARSSPTFYMSGYIVWPCFWSEALSDSEVMLLASGRHPLTVRPEHILSFWDFGNSEGVQISTNGVLALANTSTVNSLIPFPYSQRMPGRRVSLFSPPAAPGGLSISIAAYHYNHSLKA